MSNIRDIVRGVMGDISRESIDNAIRAGDYEIALKISYGICSFILNKYKEAREEGNTKAVEEAARDLKEIIHKVADIEQLIEGE